MKAILVVDIGNETNLLRKKVVSICFEDDDKIYDNFHFLKPIPKKKNLKDLKIYREEGFVKQGYLIGYNECIDDIEGGNE